MILRLSRGVRPESLQCKGFDVIESSGHNTRNTREQHSEELQLHLPRCYIASGLYLKPFLMLRRAGCTHYLFGSSPILTSQSLLELKIGRAEIWECTKLKRRRICLNTLKTKIDHLTWLSMTLNQHLHNGYIFKIDNTETIQNIYQKKILTP